MILDDRNQPVRFIGVAHHGMEVGNGNPGAVERSLTGCQGWTAPTESEYEDLSAFGFNSVRLAIAWANIEPTLPRVESDGSLQHDWNEDYLRALDRTIEEFSDRGLAVILDMHQFKWSPAFKDIPHSTGTICQGAGMPSWLYPNARLETFAQTKCDFFENRAEAVVPLPSVQDGFAAVWGFIARRYADEPTVVAADVLNEPYYSKKCPPPAFDLEGLYTKVGRVIRSENPRILLVFEDSQYKRNASFALTGPLPFANQVYSFHLYSSAWKPDGQQKVQAFSDRAREWRVPAWIGEFNRFGKPDSPPADWVDQLEEMLEYCRQRGVSWTYWAYKGSDPLVEAKSDRPNLPLVKALQSGF